MSENYVIFTKNVWRVSPAVFQNKFQGRGKAEAKIKVEIEAKTNDRIKLSFSFKI